MPTDSATAPKYAVILGFFHTIPLPVYSEVFLVSKTGDVAAVGVVLLGVILGVTITTSVLDGLAAGCADTVGAVPFTDYVTLISLVVHAREWVVATAAAVSEGSAGLGIRGALEALLGGPSVLFRVWGRPFVWFVCLF